MQEIRHTATVLSSLVALVCIALWFSVQMATQQLAPAIALTALAGLGVLGYTLHYLNRRLAEAYTDHDRSHAVVERAKDGIIVADESGTIEYVNDAAEKIFGYTESQLTGLNIATLMSAEYQDKEQETLSDFLQRNAIEPSGNAQELMGVRNNAKPFHMDVAISRAEVGEDFKYVMLVRDITERIKAQAALRDARDRLDERVKERTAELENANHHLAREIEERKALVIKLEQALDEIKILGGLLPICSSCKKVRDDEGLWNQIEVYIDEHSEASFSHGICPDCVQELYPEVARD